MTIPETPITFVEPCYALFDPVQNGVLMTQHGNLAIFSTQGMAKIHASKLPNAQVIRVQIQRITDQ